MNSIVKENKCQHKCTLTIKFFFITTEMAESLVKQKTLCVITGANQGYGKCLAEKFASALTPGSALILLARNTTKLESVATALKTSSPEVLVVYHCLDLTDFKQCSKENFETILNTTGINVSDFEQVMLLHNAGSIGDVTKFTWQLSDSASVENCINVNITGTILFNASVLSVVKKANVKTVVVINVTSIAAILPMPSMSLYCASKSPWSYSSSFPKNTNTCTQ